MIVETDFHGNRAQLYGGVMSVYEGSVGIIVSSFNGNQASVKCGGVLHGEGIFVSVMESFFTMNKAGFGSLNDRDSQRSGGVFFTIFSHVTVLMSEFIFNRAVQDGGVAYTKENSTITFLESYFTSNKAHYGGVSSAEVGSSITFNMSTCTNNRAGHSGGVIYAFESSFATIAASTIINSTAGDEGGVVSSLEDSFVIFSESLFTANSAEYFFSNRADIGSPLFVDGESSLYLFDSKMTKSVAMQHGAGVFAVNSHLVIQTVCFENNKGTVIISQGEPKSAKFSKIENCTFSNNKQSNSSFGADIFSSSIKLKQLTIRKQWSDQKSPSITVIDEAVISSISVFLEQGLPSTIVTFTKLLWTTSVSNIQIDVHCPPLLKPTMKYVSTTNDFVTHVKIDCGMCPLGYYVGNRSISTYLTRQPSIHAKCRVQRTEYLKETIYAICGSDFAGKCHKCPHGANCSSVIRALPQYWGEETPNSLISVVRCPSGYCCEKSPCPYMSSCADYREGKLCGRCRTGFSEAFLSPVCVENSRSIHLWFLWCYILWIVCAAIGIFVMKDIKDLFNNIKGRLQTLSHMFSLEKHSHQGEENDRTIEYDEEERELTDQPSIVIRKGLWKVTKLSQSEQEEAHSSMLKYVQIILFYIQDATLLQVDLPMAATDEHSGFTKRLLSMSHWTIEAVNFGQTLRFTNNLTPVTKLILQNIAGPSVLFLYFLLYLSYKTFEKCFGHS